MASASSPNPKLPDAWQMAVKKHLEALSPSQREVFVSPASVEDCLSLILQSQRKRGISRLLGVLQPIIDPLRRFEAVIDVLVQTNAGIGSPIWGPLRLAIMVATDHLKTLENLTIILERIVGSLERFRNYEILFKSNPAAQGAIGALYCDLIDFCTRVVRYHSQPSILSVFVSFNREFQNVSDSISHHSKEIDWAANAANIEEAKRARELEDEKRQAQIRGDIQRWLSPSTVQDDLFKYQNECMKGSCSWVLDTSKFRDFISSTSSDVLRVGGRPGSGKTILASFVISYLTQQLAKEVLYFFCKATDVEKKEPTHILRTLVSQLLRLDNSLYPVVQTVYQDCGRSVADSFSDLTTIFSTVIARTLKTEVYIVVDALDECQDVHSLFPCLVGSKGSDRTIKTVFTSREVPDLLQLLKDCSIEFTPPPSQVQYSMQEYVMARVAQCPHLAESALGAVVARRVTAAAGGLWLYARLVMDEIQQLPSLMAIERHLQGIPAGLRELYSQIFQSLGSSFSEWQIRFSQQVFIWIDVREYMPGWWLYNYDRMENHTISILLQLASGDETFFDPVGLLLQLCSPLVEVYYDGIDFIHYTAEQYLEWVSTAPAQEIPQILRPRRLRQLYRGVTAVWYFTHCVEIKHILETLHDNPRTLPYGSYYQMACGLWNCFYLTALPPILDEDEFAEASDLCGKLNTFLRAKECLNWIEIAVISNYAGKWLDLLGCAEMGLLMDCDKVHAVPAFQDYRSACRVFLSDYVYVLQLTGPRLEQQLELVMPDGFLDRPIAVEMLNLGKKWKWLHSGGESPHFYQPDILGRPSRKICPFTDDQPEHIRLTMRSFN